MISLFAGLALVAAVFAQLVSTALSTRLWPFLFVMAVGALALVVLPAFDWLAGLPGDLPTRALRNHTYVEAFSLAICLEAICGAALVWVSTSGGPLFRPVLLSIPFPSTLLAPLLLAQIFMARGPRIDLTLLGGAGIAVFAVIAAAVVVATRSLHRRAPDFVFELGLLLRVTALISSAAVIAALQTRPAPLLKFEPVGLALALPICLLFIAYGYFRRLRS